MPGRACVRVFVVWADVTCTFYRPEVFPCVTDYTCVFIKEDYLKMHSCKEHSDTVNVGNRPKGPF